MENSNQSKPSFREIAFYTHARFKGEEHGMDLMLFVIVDVNNMTPASLGKAIKAEMDFRENGDFQLKERIIERHNLTESKPWYTANNGTIVEVDPIMPGSCADDEDKEKIVGNNEITSEMLKAQMLNTGGGCMVTQVDLGHDDAMPDELKGKSLTFSDEFCGLWEDSRSFWENVDGNPGIETISYDGEFYDGEFNKTTQEQTQYLNSFSIENLEGDYEDIEFTMELKQGLSFKLKGEAIEITSQPSSSAQIINKIDFYDDDPLTLQEHQYGVEVDSKFTGCVEHGGKYRDSYYFIDGAEIDRETVTNGDDEMEQLVNEAIESILGHKDFDTLLPEPPAEYQYNMPNEDWVRDEEYINSGNSYSFSASVEVSQEYLQQRELIEADEDEGFPSPRMG